MLLLTRGEVGSAMVVNNEEVEDNGWVLEHELVDSDKGQSPWSSVPSVGDNTVSVDKEKEHEGAGKREVVDSPSA